MTDQSPLAGMAPTEDYVVDEHLNFMFEIETERVYHLLPAHVAPKEPRPGMSLVNVGYMKFDASLIGGDTETIELTSSIVIDPDLSLDMPMPRMCVYDFRIASNCKVFLEHEDRVQKLKGMFLPGLSRSLDRTGGHLEVFDDEGPIFTLKNPNPEPLYKYEVATGQYISQHPDGLYQGVFLWEGVGAEQQFDGDCGQLFAHSFLEEIPVEAVGDCYLQMFLPPRTNVLFRSFIPRKLI
ncbi:MAG: hypothetical protein AAFV29_06885 [Myxococcota bacterium]